MVAVIEDIDVEEFQFSHFTTGDTRTTIKHLECFGNKVSVDLEMACWFGIARGGRHAAAA